MSKEMIQTLKTGSCSAMKIKPKGSKRSTLKLFHFQNRQHKKCSRNQVSMVTEKTLLRIPELSSKSLNTSV